MEKPRTSIEIKVTNQSMTWGDIQNMTMEQARLVRYLRVEQHGSWRYVAERCSEAWNGDWDSNQMAGQDLCRYAAEKFGESHSESPWEW